MAMADERRLDKRSKFVNQALRSRFKRTEAISSTAAAAAGISGAVDLHHVNRFGRKAPRLWLSILDLKKRIPRGLHFILLFFAFLALSSSWVLPITFSYKRDAATAVQQQLCYNWHTNQSTPPPAPPWYKDPTRPSNPPRNNSLAGRGESSCANLSQISLDEVHVNVDFQQEDIHTTSIVQIAESNRKIQWLPMLNAVNKDLMGYLHAKDPIAAEYWSKNMPSLASLAIIGELYPTGTSNPLDGKMGLFMQLQTVLSYPGQLPTQYHDSNSSDADLGDITDIFVIKWTVTCNGQTTTFSSDTGMSGNLRLDCTAPTVPVQNASPSMYPFDKYQIPIAVLAQAQVTSISNPGLSIQTAVPYMQTLYSTTPSFEFTQVQDKATLFTYSWWAEGASYVYPVTYKYLIPNQLQVLTVYQMERTTIIKSWSMFLVIMMWIVSACQFVMTLDQVFLRPREVYWGAGMAALTLVWTLPSIRNSQPGIPNIGIVIDVGSFFWCELMAIAAAAILIAAQYSSYRFGAERRKKKEGDYLAREAAFKRLLEEEAKDDDARAKAKAEPKEEPEGAMKPDGGKPAAAAPNKAAGDAPSDAAARIAAATVVFRPMATYPDTAAVAAPAPAPRPTPVAAAPQLDDEHIHPASSTSAPNLGKEVELDSARTRGPGPSTAV